MYQSVVWLYDKEMDRFGVVGAYRRWRRCWSETSRQGCHRRTLPSSVLLCLLHCLCFSFKQITKPLTPVLCMLVSPVHTLRLNSWSFHFPRIKLFEVHLLIILLTSFYRVENHLVQLVSLLLFEIWPAEIVVRKNCGPNSNALSKKPFFRPKIWFSLNS